MLVHCAYAFLQLVSLSTWDYRSIPVSGYAAAAKSLQLCPPQCDPTDGSPSGSPVPGILQARTLEWVAISFSSAWMWKVKSQWPHGLQPTRLLQPWDFPGKSTGVDCHCLLPLVGIDIVYFLYQWSTLILKSIQFSSVAQSCLTLYDTMNHSTPGLPVHHQLPEFTQTHIHRVSDAIQPSHPLLSPSPAALNLSQHQALFQWVSSSHQVAKALEFQLQHQSFLCTRPSK